MVPSRPIGAPRTNRYSDQAKTDGDRDGLGRGLGTELLLGAGDISFHRTRTQLESLGDGWQTLTVCQTLQHH